MVLTTEYHVPIFLSNTSKQRTPFGLQSDYKQIKTIPPIADSSYKNYENYSSASTDVDPDDLKTYDRKSKTQ